MMHLHHRHPELRCDLDGTSVEPASPPPATIQLVGRRPTAFTSFFKHTSRVFFVFFFKPRFKCLST
jgi:hypothetical protein